MHCSDFLLTAQHQLMAINYITDILQSLTGAYQHVILSYGLFDDTDSGGYQTTRIREVPLYINNKPFSTIIIMM